MDRIYILDAVNFLFRSYYGIGPMLNGKGQSTSALYGFIRSVQKIIKDFSAEHIVAVFDGPDNKKSRQAVYAEYKMHRKGAPEDLFPQFDWAYEFCEYAGIPTLCVDGVEADDTMASVAVWAKKKGAKAFLCSSDKDLMQLVDDHIFQIHAHKDNLLIDAKKVEEIYGVRPDQMLDLLAIMGDSSDNIPGLEGFGPKTAASLLQEFGTLDAILAHPEKVKGEKKQETLRKDKEVALMSRELATLDTKVEIPHDQNFYKLKNPDLKKLGDFYHSMNFNTLLRDLGGAAPVEKPKKGKRHTEKHQYTLVDTEEELKSILSFLSEAKEICLDTETTDIHPLTAKLVGIGFGVEPGEAWYIPANGSIGYEKVVAALQVFFAHAKGSFYGHNLKYDYHILKNLGIDLENISFDTILASYLLDPQNRKHNLDELALNKFQKVKIPIEELIGKGKNEISMWDAPIEKVKEYCCEDVDYTCRLKELFEEELEEKKLEKILRDIELPLLPILAKMEREGIYLDAEKLKDHGEILSKEIGKIRSKIFTEVGEEFNLNSPKQLSSILFEKLQLKPPRKKTSEFSTSADVLEELAEENPIVEDILSYRTLEKLRSTYIEALPESINPKTGRIHCTFNQSVAATGRLSCQDPNLQNIPIRSKEGLAIRTCFKPQKRGWSFLGADYSQIELRLLAHFSEDKELVKAFKTGEDIHTHTASLVFDMPPGLVTPDMRSQAKTVNFGILYGQGPFGLSKQLHISMHEASEFIKKYFERYPRVLDFLELCKEQVRKTGASKTLTGRQRPIPEIHNKNPMIRAAAERLAINTPLQGTAADLIKIAMIEIDKVLIERKLQGKMILQIHDELIFEIPDEEIHIFQKIVKEKMEHVMKLSVPIEVHLAVGKNWGEC
ncbi:MAG: DNA polymerase I [Verrucomicrobia bacterium]|nr:DNA polymerase I [Verrucomicrobiota bacterium]